MRILPGPRGPGALVPLLFALWLGGCPRSLPVPSPAPTAARPAAVLFVSADLRGTLAPCGCSESLRGGIARTAAIVSAAREGGVPVGYADAGNALFPSATSSASALIQERERAETLARALSAMGLAARALGPLDRVGAPEAAGAAGLPSLAAGSAAPLSTEGPTIWAVSGATRSELRAAASRAREGGARLVVALLPLSLSEILDLGLRETGVDLAVASGSEGEAGAEDNRLVVKDGVPHVALQSRGRSLLRLDLAPPPRANRASPPPLPAVSYAWQPGEDDLARELVALDARIALLGRQLDQPRDGAPALHRLQREKLAELQGRRAALAGAPLPTLAPGHFTLRFVPVEATLPEDPTVAGLVAAHDARVGALNLAWAREHGEDCPAPPEGSAGYVGTAACVDCHPAAGGVWARSRHAHAWDTLVTRGKQHHLDCIGCHVVGWQRPGGVCRVDRTAERENVGCESCHGPGALHAASGDGSTIVARPDAATCAGCHNAEHSPGFDFATWLPRVLGPGHGRP